MDAHKNIHKAPQWKAISKRLAGVREDHCEVWMGVRKCSFQPLCHLRVVGWWCLLVLSFSGEHRYFNSDKKLWKTEIGRWEPQLRYTYRDPRNHLHTGIWWCLVAELITLGKPITKPQVPRPPSTSAGVESAVSLDPLGKEISLPSFLSYRQTEVFHVTREEQRRVSALTFITQPLSASANPLPETAAGFGPSLHACLLPQSCTPWPWQDAKKKYKWI